MLRHREQLEPFPCLVCRSIRRLICDQLASGDRAVRHLANYEGVLVISPPSAWPEAVWTNLNLPADLSAFIQHDESESSL
jgi:hypothetical protein